MKKILLLVALVAAMVTSAVASSYHCKIESLTFNETGLTIFPDKTMHFLTSRGKIDYIVDGETYRGYYDSKGVTDDSIKYDVYTVGNYVIAVYEDFNKGARAVSDIATIEFNECVKDY